VIKTIIIIRQVKMQKKILSKVDGHPKDMYQNVENQNDLVFQCMFISFEKTNSYFIA